MDELTSLFEQFQMAEKTLPSAVQSPPLEEGERMLEMAGTYTSSYHRAQQQRTDSITEKQPSPPVKEDRNDTEPDLLSKHSSTQLRGKKLTVRQRVAPPIDAPGS
jgi:uncharacterized protein with WD repeat